MNEMTLELMGNKIRILAIKLFNLRTLKLYLLSLWNSCKILRDDDERLSLQLRFCFYSDDYFEMKRLFIVKTRAERHHIDGYTEVADR